MVSKGRSLNELDKGLYQELLAEIEKGMTTDKKKELEVLSEALEISYEELALLRNEARKYQKKLKINLPTLEEYLSYFRS